MGWCWAALVLGLLLGLVLGVRTGWRLATRSVELMKRAHEQQPELRTLCGQHDAYLDIAEEIERSMSLPAVHTLKRIGSYTRNRIRELGEQARYVADEAAPEQLAASRRNTIG